MTYPASLPKTNDAGPSDVTAEETTAVPETQPPDPSSVVQEQQMRSEPALRGVPNAGSASKEEMVANLRQLTERNRRIPTRGEFHQVTGVHWRSVRRLFGSYRGLLKEAGFEARGPGWELTMNQLFRDWAQVVRKLGRIPSQEEYGKHSQYSLRPLATRYKSWYSVPRRMLEFAEATSVAGEWQDVLNVVKTHLEKRPAAAPTLGRAAAPTLGRAAARTLEPGLQRGRPVYGRPLMTPAMATAPTNELGVVYLFGMVAERLGFLVLRLQSVFPDCEALRRMEGEQWQRVRIEFEYESKNFLAHEHDERQCELIVCWRHNWEGCPLEVLELEAVIGEMG